MDQGSKSNRNHDAGCSQLAPQFLAIDHHSSPSVTFWCIHGWLLSYAIVVCPRIPSSVSEKTCYLVMWFWRKCGIVPPWNAISTQRVRAEQ